MSDTMRRRHFLAASVVAVPAAALPLAAMGAPAPARVLTAEVVNRTGAPAPSPGARLVLRREPERRYDPRSIAVLTEGGERLGYLPPVRSEVLATLMDSGLSGDGRVSRATAGTLEIDVYLALQPNLGDRTA
jgi:hypothetical protein